MRNDIVRVKNQETRDKRQETRFWELEYLFFD